MKEFKLSVAVPLIALGLIGCASVSAKNAQIDSVVSSQVDVLKKIVALRNQDSVKLRINADPILAEQETVLMSGLDSVISSQETFLKARSKKRNSGGSHVR